MKYTINKSETVQGKNLYLGRYVRLCDIGEGWTIKPMQNKIYYYHANKTVFVRMVDADGTRRMSRHTAREAVHKLENRLYCKYRLAKDDDSEYILEIAESVNGITWEKGIQYIRVYAQRPKKANVKKVKTSQTIAPAPVTLTSSQWAEFLK